jgi:hypothetical protein
VGGFVLSEGTEINLEYTVLRFNKEQKEGVARFSDTLAASAVIGAVVGITGHSQISRWEIGVLFTACSILLTFSYFLRSTK